MKVAGETGDSSREEETGSSKQTRRGSGGQREAGVCAQLGYSGPAKTNRRQSLFTDDPAPLPALPHCFPISSSSALSLLVRSPYPQRLFIGGMQVDGGRGLEGGRAGGDASEGHNKSNIEELRLWEIHGFAKSELKMGCTSQLLAATQVNKRVGRQQ